VPLHLVGEPIGVREGQGYLEQVVREIDLRCEPRDIPEVINVDVSNLGVHESLHISDLPADDKLEYLQAPDTVIATVGIVKEEAAAPAPIEGEGAAEPELIAKGKKDEDAGDGKKE